MLQKAFARWVLMSSMTLSVLIACGDDDGGGDGGGGQGADAGSAGSSGEGGSHGGNDGGMPGHGGAGESAGGNTAGEGGSAAGEGNAGGSGNAGPTAGSGGGGEGGTGGNDSCVAADAEFDWPVPREPVHVPAHATWKNALTLPDEPFLAVPETYDPDGVSWVKFTVLLSDPETVYFQNSKVYPFHYDFATERIPEFRGLSRQRFDALTLTSEERRAVLGAVLVPNASALRAEYAIQLVLNDAVHPELVQTIVDSVEASITAPAGTKALYFPTPAQSACADEHASYFAEHDLPVGSIDRWLVGDACYAPGWAIGKLVELPADEVDAAYIDGRLHAEDILLLADSAPAELPYVAGVLTLEPSTPNSHTAILARSYAVPFAYLRREDAKAQARALAGREVVVSAQLDYAGDCSVRFIDVTDLDASLRARIRQRAALPELTVSPKRAAGTFYLPTLGLVPADIDRVGGKAANFGVLEAAIPRAIPTPALAFTFDLWDAFMSQPAPNGEGSLGDAIAGRLAPYSWPPDLAELDETLDEIRDLVRDAPFPLELQGEVRDALEPFEPNVRIRFRSSTNVEDSETFTGAGLYDSVTGCLADDLDDDTLGPSLCNPEETEERGVYRAIKRVFSSFYARNAFFQRLARGVSERDVGMAVLAHYSVPDSFELANGVATVTVESDQNVTAELVTQVGAVSVTNPDGSATPETVRMGLFGTTVIPQFVEGSSLLLLGEHVLTWESEYKELLGLLDRVADEYARTVEPKVPFTLDFEYKKVEPGVLQIRQVRPLPEPDVTVDVVPIVVGEPTTLCVLPGEVSDVFAMHRLKSRIALTAQSSELTPEHIAERLYTRARVEHLDDDALTVLEGDPSTFPVPAHTVNGSEVRDAWTSTGARWTLTTTVEPLVARNASPVVLARDWAFVLSAQWDEPVPYLDFFEGPLTRTEDSVTLWASCPDTAELETGSTRVERSFADGNGLLVSTSYWYPPGPRGPTAGYTAPIVKWEKTTISGLTSEPIVLEGYYSQTHRPSHHNFGGDYIFDPRLEPGISEATLAELVEANIAYLMVIDVDTSTDEAHFWLAGLDGTLRPL